MIPASADSPIKGPVWARLAQEALTKPGVANAAFGRFHGYSLGNSVLAVIQMMERGLDIGPLASYHGWQKLGRQVQKGQKSLWLLHPVKVEEVAEDGSKHTKVVGFTMKPGTFTLSQTVGEDVTIDTVNAGDWTPRAAMERLKIKVLPFDLTNGNALGFCTKQGIALNPTCPPEQVLGTLTHEMAHFILHLGGEASRFVDGEVREYADAEVEAELASYLVMASLGEPDDRLALARGYIQKWQAESHILTDKLAARAFKAADLILWDRKESKL